MQLIHITPEAPPALGGVAQYISEFVRHESIVGFKSIAIIVVGSRTDGAAQSEGDTVPVVHASADTLAEAVCRYGGGESAIVLHYVGYGYDSKGAPLRLISALLAAKRAAGIPLVTLFHEVYASGMPWRPVFWYSIAQRYVARVLARASEVVLCTTNRARGGLAFVSGIAEAEFHQICIPSTLGEPGRLTPWAERLNVCVLFGKKERKEELLHKSGAAISRILGILGITEILDLGERISNASAAELGGGIQLKGTGVVAKAAIAEVFGRSKYFLVETPADWIDKSTVFANGVAHGCVPVWASSPCFGWAENRNLVVDQKWLAADYLSGDEAKLSQNCRSYYEERRSWQVHLELWRRVVHKVA